MNKYLWEAENQFNDTEVYRDVSNTENILGHFQQQVMKLFTSFKRRDFLMKRQLTYFSYNLGKATFFVN